jgi:hypothetical protein
MTDLSDLFFGRSLTDGAGAAPVDTGRGTS